MEISVNDDPVVIEIRQSKINQQSNSAEPETEQLLTGNDQHRSARKKFHVTWNTFIGTMSEMEEFYARNNFLNKYLYFRSILMFIDSVFRGIGTCDVCQ